MCAICVNVVQTTFPEYANDDRFIDLVLWEYTAFPWGSAKQVAHQVLMVRGTLFVQGEGI